MVQSQTLTLNPKQMNKFSEITLRLVNCYEDCWRRICVPEYFSESEIMLAKAAIFRHGVHGLVIDPYNELDHRRPANQLETEYADHLKQSSQRSMVMDP